MTNNLGTWIKAGLVDVGKNQAWLADQVGVQPPQISRIISGESEATPDILNRMADALRKPRIQAYRAAGHFGEVNDEDAWIEKMNHKMKLLTPASRPIAERLLNALLEETRPATATKKAKTKV